MGGFLLALVLTGCTSSSSTGSSQTTSLPTTVAIVQLRDELAAATRSNEWLHAQFGEVIRILVRDLREMRTMLICLVVSEGPISAQSIETLLRLTPEDRRELELGTRPAHRHRGN